MQKDNLVEPANTGVEGQGFGLAAHRKGIYNMISNSGKVIPLPAHLTKNTRCVSLKNNLGRVELDEYGRRNDKMCFNLSKRDIQ